MHFKSQREVPVTHNKTPLQITTYWANSQRQLSWGCDFIPKLTNSILDHRTFSWGKKIIIPNSQSRAILSQIWAPVGWGSIHYSASCYKCELVRSKWECKGHRYICRGYLLPEVLGLLSTYLIYTSWAYTSTTCVTVGSGHFIFIGRGGGQNNQGKESLLLGFWRRKVVSDQWSVTFGAIIWLLLNKSFLLWNARLKGFADNLPTPSPI